MIDCKFAARSWPAKSCQFEPRYDMSPSIFKAESSRGYDADELTEIMDQYRKKTYVRDVCVTCGKTIEREK